MEQPDRQFNELFQALKQEDTRRTPSFTRTWATAAAHSADNANQRPVWRWAVVALALLACAGVWFALFRRAPVERIALPVTPPAEHAVPAPLREPQEQAIAASSGKSVRQAKQRRHRLSPPLPLETLVSQWRSPTDFLLKPPGERWLKEVPRLGVPRLEIKPFVIEQNNEMEEL
ncbi:MAG: hypothetical protein HYR56_14655 [Acidobacteria bacterium]|nr:hypothetical protein [Acidobacteriota bacterium]MBI3425782.1 hypothetical protein [Acidobacteriota bacterium]